MMIGWSVRGEKSLILHFQRRWKGKTVFVQGQWKGCQRPSCPLKNGLYCFPIVLTLFCSFALQPHPQSASCVGLESGPHNPDDIFVGFDSSVAVTWLTSVLNALKLILMSSLI